MVEVSRADGSLVSWSVGGVNLIAPAKVDGGSNSGSKLDRNRRRCESMHCLWRAPTDNDRGGILELLSMVR